MHGSHTSSLKFSPKSASERRWLRAAARAYGIQPSYKGVSGEVIWAPDETLVFVLSELAEREIKSVGDFKDLLRDRRKFFVRRGIEPTAAMWKGERGFVRVYLNENELGRPARLVIANEAGTKIIVKKKLSALSPRIPLPAGLPLGYWRFAVETGERKLTSLLIVAPKQLKADKKFAHSWGPFLPLYAVRSEHDWGMGSFAELKQAAKVTKKHGARWVGSLPILAGNYAPENKDVSPYNALTRLFWNEIYLDINALVAKRKSKKAAKLIESKEFQAEIAALRASDYADYHGVYRAKRKILEILAGEFFASGGEKKAAFRRFLERNPDAEDYARFRARDKKEQRLHLYAQYETMLQLDDLSRLPGSALYLDYPVGVNEQGFDYHKYRDIFFNAVTVGAPPEKVFALGQEWGFPALHPWKIRESGYLYVRRTLQNHFRYCKILRLDHVMGLHRVYGVPKGKSPKAGVYLRFKPEELFAVAALEAHRHGADLVGENLGTVPEAVDTILKKRKFNGMWVFQEKIGSAGAKIPEGEMACFNTHDMPMFHQFLSGNDLEEVRDLGILNRKFVGEFRAERREGIANWASRFKLRKEFEDREFPQTLFRHALEFLAGSAARYLVFNLEDAWGETRPQNVPGTFLQVPNWRRKFRLKIEEWENAESVRTAFEILRKKRRKTC